MPLVHPSPPVGLDRTVQPAPSPRWFGQAPDLASPPPAGAEPAPHPSSNKNRSSKGEKGFNLFPALCQVNFHFPEKKLL